MHDNRGTHGRAIGEANRLQVWLYFQQNPVGRQKDCAEVLGLSAPAVNRCVKAIRDGWRPSKHKQAHNE